MMRALANLFLLLFFADGGISLLDELCALFSAASPLAAVRPVVASVLFLMAEVIYLCMSFDRRLPKRVFIPLILYIFLLPVVQWFFPSLAHLPGFALVAAAVQMILPFAVTRRFWKGDKPALTLPNGIFSGPAFSLKNMLAFSAVNMVVLPVVLVLGTMVATDRYMQSYTAGFMRLSPDGLHMIEKVYKRDGKTIRLASMIHMGEKEYYDQVMGSVAPGRTIVLAEGVSDNRSLLRSRPDYGKLAGYLGLASQQDEMHFSGRQIKASELEGRAQPKGDQVDILRADVDISTFRPATIWFLESLGKQMQESKSLSGQLLASVAWSEKNMTPEIQQGIMDDILNRRNQVLVGHLRKALQRYDNVVIPWGALHMAGIEQEVVKDGFQLQQVNDRVSIRFMKQSKQDGRSLQK